MESQQTLDDIMTKKDNLLKIMNSFNQHSENSVPCVFPTVREVKEKPDNNKSKKKRTFLRFVLQISATNFKVMSMLLSTVQAHLRLSSMTEFLLKHLSLIVLFFWKSLKWLKSLLSLVIFLPQHYCQHYLLRLLYYRLLLTLPVLITNSFLLYYRYHLCSLMAYVRY